MNISKKFKPEDFKLCYVRDNKAFFTTLSLEKQWGDDWDDAPYEHNAGSPYLEKGQELVTLYFSGEFNEPCSDLFSSPYSVKSINAGAIPWLRHFTKNIYISAGTTLPKFIELVESAGDVYVPFKCIK